MTTTVELVRVVVKMAQLLERFSEALEGAEAGQPGPGLFAASPGCCPAPGTWVEPSWREEALALARSYAGCQWQPCQAGAVAQGTPYEQGWRTPSEVFDAVHGFLSPGLLPRAGPQLEEQQVERKSEREANPEASNASTPKLATGLLASDPWWGAAQAAARRREAPSAPAEKEEQNNAWAGWRGRWSALPGASKARWSPRSASAPPAAGGWHGGRANHRVDNHYIGSEAESEGGEPGMGVLSSEVGSTLEAQSEAFNFLEEHSERPPEPPEQRVEEPADTQATFLDDVGRVEAVLASLGVPHQDVWKAPTHETIYVKMAKSQLKRLDKEPVLAKLKSVGVEATLHWHT